MCEDNGVPNRLVQRYMIHGEMNHFLGFALIVIVGRIMKSLEMSLYTCVVETGKISAF